MAIATERKALRAVFNLACMYPDTPREGVFSGEIRLEGARLKRELIPAGKRKRMQRPSRVVPRAEAGEKKLKTSI